MSYHFFFLTLLFGSPDNTIFIIAFLSASDSFSRQEWLNSLTLFSFCPSDPFLTPAFSEVKKGTPSHSVLTGGWEWRPCLSFTAALLPLVAEPSWQKGPACPLSPCSSELPSRRACFPNCLWHWARAWFPCLRPSLTPTPLGLRISLMLDPNARLQPLCTPTSPPWPHLTLSVFVSLVSTWDYYSGVAKGKMIHGGER